MPATTHAEPVRSVAIADTGKLDLLHFQACIARPSARHRFPCPRQVRVILNVDPVEVVDRWQGAVNLEGLGHVLRRVGLRLRSVGDIEGCAWLVTHQADQAVLNGQLGIAARQRVVNPVLGRTGVVDHLVVILAGILEHRVQSIPLRKIDIGIGVTERLQHVQAPRYDAPGGLRRCPGTAGIDRKNPAPNQIDLAFRLRGQPVSTADLKGNRGHPWVT
ncbi:hypothetical protein D3C85_1326830 [compost metagenome]